MIIGGGGGLLPPEQSHRQLEVGPLVHYSGEARETWGEDQQPFFFYCSNPRETKDLWRVYNLNIAVIIMLKASCTCDFSSNIQQALLPDTVKATENIMTKI